MSLRRSVRLPLRAFLPLTALSLWVACSSDATDFFGAPHHGGSGGTKNTGGAAALAGASSGRSGAGGTGGTGGTMPGGGPNGGSGARGGSSPDAGTTSTGGMSLAGEGSGASGGTGGSSTGGSGSGGTSSSAGGMSGEAGTVDTAGGGGMSGAAAGDAGSGGTSAGSGGTAGGGMGGVAGGAGTAGGGIGGIAGMAGTVSTMSCASNADCDANQYCKKTTCDGPWGVCAPRPPHCNGPDADLAPVCGCDHMTYYTPCVAAHEGVNVSASGECGADAATCTRTGGGASCTPQHDRAACYRVRTSCSGTSPNNGTCWVLPDTCPTEAAANYYCNVGGTPECLGFCDGLESNVPLILNASQCN